MKVKTITCHDVYNAGASLQAYALVTYLHLCGHEAEIIDYKPKYLCHYRLWGGNEAYRKPLLWQAYNLAKLPGRVKGRMSKKKKAFDRFTETYLSLTEKRYASNEELKSDPPPADVYLAGSDQIWNPLFPNGRDPAFYLDFAPAGSVRASYAASFATDSLPEEWKSPMAGWLGGLQARSVRELSGVRILEELGFPGAVQVLDPVFLLDAAHWDGMTVPMDVEEPYLLVYDFDRNPDVAAFVQGTAKKRGWRIYSVFPCAYCDRCFPAAGPQQFLTLVRHAAFVVSNSFHATAFSLLFRKQFVVFDRSEDINARMRDLLELFGLAGRRLSGEANCGTEIEYEAVFERLETYRRASEAYLENVLKRRDCV